MTHPAVDLPSPVTTSHSVTASYSLKTLTTISFMFTIST